MGRLAVIMGSKRSVSSQKIPPAVPVEDYDGDDPTRQTLLRPVPRHDDDDVEVITAVSGSLQALTSAHAYPRVRVSSSAAVAEASSSYDDPDRRYHSRVAEIRIRIIPVTAALSSSSRYREGHYRVELPPAATTTTATDTTSAVSSSSQLVFSADQRFLLLLLGGGSGGGGDLILFQLRRPRHDRTSKTTEDLPRPSYLPPAVAATTTILPVATQPRHVSLPTAAAAAVAPGPASQQFWIGTVTGSLHVLVGRPCVVVNVQEASSTTMRPSTRVSALEFTSSSDDDDHEHGRLAVLDAHRQVHVLETSYTASKQVSSASSATTGDDDDRHVKRTKPVISTTRVTTLPCETAVHAVLWLGGTDYLLTLTQETATVTLTVWYHSHHDDNHHHPSWIPCRTHVIRKDSLEGRLRRRGEAGQDGPIPTLRYDAASETVVVRAAFVRNNVDDDGASCDCWPVGCLWSWRTHVRGWTRVVSSPHAVWSLVGSSLIVTSWDDRTIHKERYDTALLSPPSRRSTASSSSSSLDAPNPLLLTDRSVWYPVRTVDAGREQLEWMESSLPVDYVSSYGAPTAAAWSAVTAAVAVAADRGVLVVRPGGWRRFAHSSAEGRLEVLAMTWWDDNVKPASNHADDAVLVALVRVRHGDGSDDDRRTTYLSCWSSRFVDADKQLLTPVPSYDNGENSWGMALPEDMGTDLRLDLLSEGNRAVVLASSRTTTTTQYRVYQMQIVPAPPKTDGASYHDHRPFSVLATGIATGNVESCSKLWLASTSFGFDLVALKSGKLDLRLLDYVATLGVWRRTHGTVDALAISPDTVVAVGEVCRETSAVVVDLWPADRNRVSVSWALVLSNGKIITWKLVVACKPADHVVLAEPIDEEQHGTGNGPRWVNENSRLVGKVCPTESTSAWMQGAGSMTNNELFLGRMPGGRFGYAIAAGQNCRRMHRMLGEDFESEIFLSDFLQNEVFGPGDLVLKPPMFVSPMYMTILENPESLRDFLNLPITRESDRNAVLLALRLLIFVSVDRMATNKPGSSTARKARTVFQAAVSIARELLGKESLKFVAFVIELARQMEPSRFEHLLPLPPPGNETIGRLLEISSSNGSISLSLAALPLLSNKSKARMICANTFQLCLSACMKPQSVHHPVRREASDALSDLFRFGLKLEDTAANSGDEDEFLERSIDADYFDDDSSDDDDRAEKQPQYSMFCGISRLFGGNGKIESRKTAAAANSFIDHGFKGHDPAVNVRALGLTSAATPHEGVTDVVAHMLHTLLLDVSHLMLWGSAARMASMLLPESLAGLHLATKQECTFVLRETSVRSIRHILPKEFRRKDGLVDFFSASISRCMDCLDDTEALSVVDLVRVIIKRKLAATDRQAEHQAILLLVLLVVGHVTGKVEELIEEDVEHLVMVSFHKAIQGPEPPAQNGDDGDASSQVTEEATWGMT